MSLVFSAVEFVNIVWGSVGAEALSRFVDRVVASQKSMRNLARRVDAETGGLIVDRRAFAQLLSDATTWQALLSADPMAVEPVSQRLARVVLRGTEPDDHLRNCRVVVEALAREITRTLSLVEQLQLKTYTNTTLVLDDVSELGVTLDRRLTSLEAALRAVAAGSDVLQFPALSGVSTPTRTRLDGVISAAVAIHRESCELAGTPDIWLAPNFERDHLKQALNDLQRLFDPPPLPGELLLMHVVPLFIDALLRIESVPRMEALTEGTDSGLLRADIARIGSLREGIVLRNERRPDPQVSAWLAHQATLMSPSIWESWSAYRLAIAFADLIEDRAPRRSSLASLIRRLGRNAAYNLEEFETESWPIRLPGQAESLAIQPARTAGITRFVWRAIVDLRRVGLRVVEQPDVASLLPEAIEDLNSAQWDVEGGRLELDAWCSHPAVAQALIEHAAELDRELDELRRAGVLPVRSELRVGSGRVRPRLAPSGKPIFSLPLIQLRLSQEEIRRLLMGTALYGRPELAIREMYQNAMDACRYRAMRHDYLRLTRQNATPYEPQVTIRQWVQIDGSTVIECADNGVGMGYREIRDAFAQAGKRFTDMPAFQDEHARWMTEDPRLRLYPNSRFGIGVFSYFMLADTVEITTVQQKTDGSLSAGLLAEVSSLSGLLTVVSAEPGAVADGTTVRLTIPSVEEQDPEVARVSVLDVLEDLVWYSEVDLTVEEEGRETRHWEAGQLASHSSAKLAFETEGCRGWWTQGQGAVLADGIRTDVDLRGVIVDLRGPHSPSMRADRNQLLRWDRDWVVDEFARSAHTVSDWEDVDLDWLWKLALKWPSVGAAVDEALRSRDEAVTIGVGPKADLAANPNEVGCFPGDIVLFNRDRLASPFPPTPPRFSDRSYSSNLVSWPTRLGALRRSFWIDLVGPEAVVEGQERSAVDKGKPVSWRGFPVPTALDSALLCAVGTLGGRVWGELSGFEPANLPAMCAGAARSGVSLGAAVRRVRRFQVAGTLAPAIDARDLDDIFLDLDVIDLLVTLSAEIGSPTGEVTKATWFCAGIAAAHHLHRPLGEVWVCFAAMEALGMEGVPPALPASLADRVPSSRECDVLVEKFGGFTLAALIARSVKVGLRTYAGIERILRPYAEPLGELGVRVNDLSAITALQKTEKERIAWSRELDGVAPWLFGEWINQEHVLRVANTLQIGLADSVELLRRCPGAQLTPVVLALPDTEVSNDDLRLSRLWLKSSGMSRVNALERAHWARSHGFDPRDAFPRLTRMGLAQPVEVDWDRVENFSLGLLQRELLMRRRAAAREVGPVGDAVGPMTLVDVSIRLRIDVKDLIAAAEPLSSIGIICRIPEAGCPTQQPRERDRTLLAHLGRGAGHCASLLVELASTVEPAEAGAPRILQWMRWFWHSEPAREGALAALELVSAELDWGAIDPITPAALYSIELLALDGLMVRRAHILEIAASLGVSVPRIEAVLSPFEAVLETLGCSLPRFDEASETPPTWLDVAVASVVVAGATSAEWDEANASLVLGNVDAPVAEVRQSWHTWARQLLDDPVQSTPTHQQRSVTGMHRWDAAGSSKR